MPRIRISAAALLALLLAPAAHAQDALPRHEAADAGRIERVTVYPQRAAVTRVLRRDLEQGLWTVRVTGLPPKVESGTLQAKVLRGGDSAAGSAPKLLGVEFAETALPGFQGSPEGLELANRIEQMRRDLAQLEAEAAILGDQDKLADQVAERAAANATANGATGKQDLERTAKELAWVREEKTRTLAGLRENARKTRAMKHELAALEAGFAQRGGATRTERSALVQIAVPEAGPVELELTYIVPDANWMPTYAIRASGDRTTVAIEYEAAVTQATGEAWNDVTLALSTAAPARASAPPEVPPLFLEVWAPPPPAPPGRPTSGARYASKDKTRAPAAGGTGGMPGGTLTEGGESQSAENDRKMGYSIAALAADANVGDAGIAASFSIPRRVSVPSDAGKTQRTRIATVDPTAKFVYVAAPVVTESVFLRGDLVNGSGFQFLPGPAQIFMGGDFIGTTAMPSVAPNAEFAVFFGPDRALTARREVVSRTTGTAGLFGGSVATTWKYRVLVDNGTGRAVTMELLDRRPVSRNEKLEIKLADLSAPLSTDARYAQSQQPTGILRWDLTVPPTARGPAAMAVTWGVQETHPKDQQITALPD